MHLPPAEVLHQDLCGQGAAINEEDDRNGQVIGHRLLEFLVGVRHLYLRGQRNQDAHNNQKPLVHRQLPDAKQDPHKPRPGWCLRGREARNARMVRREC